MVKLNVISPQNGASVLNPVELVLTVDNKKKKCLDGAKIIVYVNGCKVAKVTFKCNPVVVGLKCLPLGQVCISATLKLDKCELDQVNMFVIVRTNDCSACQGKNCGDAWTTLGHDDFNTRSNPGEHIIGANNVATLSVAAGWSETAFLVDSTPVVKDGIAYFVDGAAILYAVDNITGSIIWKVDNLSFLVSSTVLGGTNVFGCPCLSNGKLFVAVAIAASNTTPIESWLFSFDPATGITDPNWPATGIIIPAGLPGAGTESHAVRIDDPILAQGQSSVQASPVVANGLVIIGLANKPTSNPSDQQFMRGSIQSYSVLNGALKWRFVPSNWPVPNSAGTDISFWSTPAIDRKRNLLYVGTSNASNPPAGLLSAALLALKIDTCDPNGELVWSRQLEYNAVYSGKTFPAGKDYDVGASPNLFTAEVEYLDDDGCKLKKCVDMVGVCGKAGIYIAFNRSNGNEIWRQEIGITPSAQNGNGSAAVSDGIIYVLSRDDVNQVLPVAFIVPPNPGGQVGPLIASSAQQTSAERGNPVCGMTGPCAGPQSICIPPTSACCCGQLNFVVKAISACTGEVYWTFRNVDPITGVSTGISFNSICVANGIVYAASITGHIYALAAGKAGPNLIVNIDLTTQLPCGLGSTITVNSPMMVAEGKLYVGYSSSGCGLSGIVALAPS